MTKKKDHFSSFFDGKLIFILVGLLIGLIYVMPHVFIWYNITNSPESKDVIYDPFIAWSDLKIYSSMVKHVVDGNLPYEVYTYENDKPPYFTPFFPILIFGGLCLLFFGGNMALSYIVLSGIFAIILFFLLILLCKKLFKNQELWLIIPTTVLLATPVSFIFFRLTNSLFDILRFFRMINPVISFILFLLAVYFFVLSVQKNSKLFAFLSGLFFSSLFYSYLYAWSSFLVFLILFAVFTVIEHFIWQKFTRQNKLLSKNTLHELLKVMRSKLSYVLIVIIIGFLFAVPYFINSSSYMKTYGNDLYYNTGLYTPPNPFMPLIDNPIINYFVYALLIIGILFAIFLIRNENSKVKKIKDMKISFGLKIIFALFFSSFICFFGPPILLNRTIQPDHWVRFLMIPSFFILGIVFLFSFVDKYLKKLKSLLVPLIIIYLILNSVCSIYFVTKETYSSYELSKESVVVYDWMNKNTEKNTIFLTFNTVFLEIPTYTHNYVFSSDALTKVPYSELIDRQAIMFSIYNVSPSMTNDIIMLSEDNLADSNLSFFKLRPPFFEYYMLTGALIDPKTMKVYHYLKNDTSSNLWNSISFYNKNDICVALNKYKLDYVYFGIDEQYISNRNFDSDPHFEKVYDDNNTKIYKVKKELCNI